VIDVVVPSTTIFDWNIKFQTNIAENTDHRDGNIVIIVMSTIFGVGFVSIIGIVIMKIYKTKSSYDTVN